MNMPLRIHKLFRTCCILKSGFGSPASLVLKRHTNNFPQPKFVVCDTKVPIFNERNFAHRILENNPLYTGMLIKPAPREKVDLNFSELLGSVNWSDLTVDELVKKIEIVSQSSDLPLSHDLCADLRSAIIKNCDQMTDDHLVSVLTSLSKWPFSESVHEGGFYEAWKAIDLTCLARWRKWDLDTVFYFMELWYSLYLSRQSDYVFKVVGKMLNRPNRLSKEQVVLLLFHLSVLRTVTKSMPMFLLETRLAEIADQLTLDELAVAVMGFFKADKSLLNENLMSILIDKLVQGIKTVDDIPFTAIIKELRKSLAPSLFSRAGEIADAVVPEVDRLSVSAVSHAALFTTKPQMLHPPLLRSAAQKLVDNIPQARMKEMEKTIFSLTQMAFDPQTNPCIFNAVLEELDKPERSEEIMAYPKSFVALVHYMCLRGIFPDKLIRKILDMDFITKTYGPKKFYFGRELLFMDCCVELEYPSYSGPRLNRDLRAYLSKKYSEVLPDPSRKCSRHQKWHLEVYQTAQLLFNKECTCHKYLLPHHPKADIIVHLDDENKPLPLSEELTNGEDFVNFLRAPGSNYFALVPASINMYIWNSDLLNGENQAKLRQLKMIGYTPIVVGYKNWPYNGTFEKADFLKNLINSFSELNH